MDMLKFRVWDVKENKYSNADWYLDNGGCLCYEHEYRDYLSSDSTHEMLNANSARYLIEPCTGMKDANGKLIFAGDLLINNGDNDARFEVFYNDDTAQYSCVRVHYSGSRCGGYIPELSCQMLEVVGNIHEVTK